MDVHLLFFMDGACSDELNRVSTATVGQIKHNATHVLFGVADSPRLPILGGVEKGRGGKSSLAPRRDGGPRPRGATGYMSGISSGTGGLFVSVSAMMCVCGGGKCEARGVEV